MKVYLLLLIWGSITWESFFSKFTLKSIWSENPELIVISGLMPFIKHESKEKARSVWMSV